MKSVVILAVLTALALPAAASLIPISYSASASANGYLGEWTYSGTQTTNGTQGGTSVSASGSAGGTVPSDDPNYPDNSGFASSDASLAATVTGSEIRIDYSLSEFGAVQSFNPPLFGVARAKLSYDLDFRLVENQIFQIDGSFFAANYPGFSLTNSSGASMLDGTLPYFGLLAPDVYHFSFSDSMSGPADPFGSSNSSSGYLQMTFRSVPDAGGSAGLVLPSMVVLAGLSSLASNARRKKGQGNILFASLG